MTNGSQIQPLKLSSTTYFITGFFLTSISDLIEAFIAYIFAVISTFQQRWLFGYTGCALYGFVCFATALSNIFTHVALAVYRYRCVCKPKFLDLSLDPSTSLYLVVLGIWSLSIAWSVLPFIGWGRYGPEPFDTSCSINWHATDYSNFSYTISTFFTTLIIPAVVMIGCYVKMACYNKQLRRNITPLDAVPPRTTCPGCSSANGSETTTIISSAQTTLSILEQRANCVISVTMILFFVAWLPYGILSIMAAFGFKVTPSLAIVPVMLAKSQSAFNPIVIISMHAHVRKALKALLLKNPAGLELPVADNDQARSVPAHTRTSKF
ncbi:rhodopsin, G0-coupled-like [Tubulanus polymorphus]|uniref:rhodopsin, G0-coupled-like n=1 Tax=Tubulanus polymorphus TaxID=672921 RepID=UPI003DA54EBA